MKRKVIKIDDEKCNGCGMCIPNCPEGALQIIDGKARLVSDLFCDGLGACIGHCPEGAITVEEREAEEYDERKVMKNVVKHGLNTVKAHLTHLKEHQQHEYYQQALEYLQEQGIEIPKEEPKMHKHEFGGCPGSQSMSFDREEPIVTATDSAPQPSQLRHWPIQMHLITPRAPQFQGADLLLAADCTAFSLGDFHQSYLKDKALVIACPKLDEGKDIYLQKLMALIDDAKINTLTVMMMQVPCCGGLLQLAQEALAKSTRKIPIKKIVIGLEGNILQEEWI